MSTETTSPTVAQQITATVDRLPPASQQVVLTFVEFLLSRPDQTSAIAPQPNDHSASPAQDTDTSDRLAQFMAGRERYGFRSSVDYQFDRNEIYDR
ncbi:MAG: hypothetical protein EA001_02220 [Oscillatoriales cyanobacterium]|nr:MAG: hypothetical protein EA001_02220 [Oscillatoriales cyanobacterium]